jgi:hypothetical protein
MGPEVSQPERKQRSTSAISASPIEGRKKGTLIAPDAELPAGGDWV